MKVSVAEAKNTLPRLIKAVEDGESVTIYRHGTPVVDIVRTTNADPFDRQIIAQALVENVPVVTPDEAFHLSEGLKVIW